MSKAKKSPRIDISGPAFPVGLDCDQYGMTLRDWFAGQALVGLIINPETGGHVQDFAKCAYNYADAMLKEREK